MKHRLWLRLIWVMIAVNAAGLAIDVCGQAQMALSDTLAKEIVLPELDVKARKDHYTKRGNPAVALMRRLRHDASLQSPLQDSIYTFREYERIVISLNDVSDSVGQDGKFSFLNQYVDSSNITGTRHLPLSVREKLSNHYYRLSPKGHREVIYGVRREGLDELFDEGNVAVILEDMLRPIDIFSNDITLLGDRYVSPLSAIGPDFYKYYIGDTLVTDGAQLASLEFAPRNSASHGFVGRLWYDYADSLLMIRNVEMSLPPGVNVNFLKKLRVSQRYSTSITGRRVYTSDRLILELELLPGTPGLLVERELRSVAHRSGSGIDPSPFYRIAEVSQTSDAWLHDDDFWDRHRIGVGGDPAELMARMMEQMRSVGSYRAAEKLIKIIASGYIPTATKSKLDIGPINSLVSFNDVEGTRLRVGALTTAAMNRRWFGRGYVAWGTRDHRWKGGGEVEYSFIDKQLHSREFPIRSIKASASYDTYAPGQQFALTSPDNLFLSLRHGKDTLMLYRREVKIEYVHELENHLSWQIALHSNRDYSTRYLSWYVGGVDLSHVDFTGVTATMRYAPGEKFYQTRSKRLPINSDAPVFKLTQSFIPGHILNNRWQVVRTDLAIQKRWWFSAFGYLDTTIKGGHVWSRSPYTQLIIPNANLSYTIQPESYSLLSEMEFIMDSYISIDATYFGNGIVFNHIPGFKKFKLREVVGFSGFWGHLSKHNDPKFDNTLPCFPSSTQELRNTPYMEVSAGLDNLLSLFRVEWVWRLSYLDNPGIIKSGPRVAVHFTF